MDYLILNLTDNELQKLTDSDLDWYPDDLSDPDNSDVVFSSNAERNLAARLIGRI